MIQPLLRSFARVKTRVTNHEGAQQISQFPTNPISPTSGHCIRPVRGAPGPACELVILPLALQVVREAINIVGSPCYEGRGTRVLRLFENRCRRIMRDQRLRNRRGVVAGMGLVLGLAFLEPALAQKSLGTRRSMDNAREAPADVIFERDVPYRKGHDRWVLNVVTPKEESKVARPAIVVVHGGGWGGNDHYRFSSLAFFLAQQGYVAVAPTHRMIQDGPFPACLEDIKNSIRWLRANAERYNVDTKRIGAYGDSSGAQLVVMAALTGRKKLFEGDGPYREFSSEIQAVVGSGTVGDMQHAEHSERAAQVYRNLAGSRGDKLSEEQISAVLKQASPATYVSQETPPIMLVHGVRDDIVFVQSTDEFLEVMKEAGAPISYLRYEDGGHAVMFQKQSETIPAMLKFFAKHLAAASQD